MYLLLTDETNIAHNPGTHFFIYGGIFFPIENLSSLHAEVESIRTSCGYQPGDTLKFDTNARPPNVTVEQATDAKRRVVEMCMRLDVRFVVHVIHHGIIQQQHFAQQVTWAADYVIGRFNIFLDSQGAPGICIIDNLPPDVQYRYLSEKFQIGLNHPTTTMRLNNIKMFAASCVDASHANSVMDIVLGSFRYCVNEPANQTAAQGMMRNIFRLLWKRQNTVSSLQADGLIFRPPITEVRVDAYKQQYEELLRRLEEML